MVFSYCWDQSYGLRLAILPNDLNFTDDIVVQLFQFFGGNPPFSVVGTPNFLDLIVVHKRFFDAEPSDIANPTRFDIPLGGNRDRVLLVCDWVKDGLLR